jgi:hypothetical protein
MVTVTHTQPNRVQFVYDDGGRSAAGLLGVVGDCAVRAVAIVCELPYATVRQAFIREMYRDEFCRRWNLAEPDGGVPPHITDGCLRELGWRFTLNEAHLTMHDLPPGRFLLDFREALTKPGAEGHIAALVDGELRDIVDNTDSHMWGWWSTRNVRRQQCQ